MIKRDQYIANKLIDFDGKCIAVRSSQPSFSLTLRFEDNALKLSAIDSQTAGLKPDASIAAKAGDLLSLLQPSNKRALADTALTISGDAALAQDLYQLVNSLDIDWQDYLTPLLGDILSNELGKFANATKAWGSDVSSSAQSNLRDYLSEEARLVPTKPEIDNFAHRIDQLRLQIDRATARSEHLKRRLALALE